MARLGAAAILGLVGLASPMAAATVSRAALTQAARDGEVAVIVALRPGAAMTRQRAALLGEMSGDGLVAEHLYQSVAGFSGRASRAALERLAARPEVLRVDLDPVGGVASDSGVTHIRADRVQRRSVTGAGVTIAVIDTGVDADHPDIADALVAEECFCRGGESGGISRRPCCPDGGARESGPGSAASAHEHGPHVAGIALSRGIVSPRGVAPDAKLVAVRVLDAQNRGFLSDWIAALDWIASERPDVRVVNMSLASWDVYAGDCGRCTDSEGCAANRLFADAIEQLWKRGVLVFVASGNRGRPNAMSTPACVGRAIAVGAVDGGDAIASFSNRSDALDLLAPGVDILSDGLDGGLATLSGTSMASPHAAGEAALLISARPGLNSADVLRLLSASGVPVADPRSARAWTRIDAFAALRDALRSPELVRGGGSRATDCLLELSVLPPDAVSASATALATCRDDDALCDLDQTPGQCTFGVALCANLHDPLLRGCAPDESITALRVEEPSLDAPPGSGAHDNALAINAALPRLPVVTTDTCGVYAPFVVPSGAVASLRLRAVTATRGDSDRMRFRCLPR
ncbi:MAG: S8 family serine peptidase [Deltaproteobacteria bacterium]|nr:S8 family serine peptidase [Deltaproteobacteria bacterium]